MLKSHPYFAHHKAFIMKKLFTLCVLIVFTANALFAQDKNVKKIASTIKAKELKQKLTIIAGADMEGRETATEGQRKAADYIENYFKKLGLLAGNFDSYQMYFPVYMDTAPQSSLIINNTSYTAMQDYSFNAGNTNAGNSKTNEIVFAGYGLKDSASDDYTNLDVKDKWVLVMPASSKNPGDKTSYTNYQKFQQAKAHNAAGLLIVSNDFPKTATDYSRGNMTNKAPVADSAMPVIYVSFKLASQIVGRDISTNNLCSTCEKKAYAARLSFTLTKSTIQLQSSNVIAVLPGTDKKDEYIFITAHYDHLGKRGDIIYYGADDDGSGTASVLEIAEAFANARDKGFSPRRTIVFMTVSGEEKGLWGSEYYTDHPIFPLNKTTVDLNIDMVGRQDPTRTYGDKDNYVYTIGDDKLSTDLAKITDSINNLYTHLELDRKFNDPNDPNRFYYRSDHYNFAKNGVPVIFYFNGTHADYHQPTDTVDKIVFKLMAKRVKLVFYTAWEMANRDGMIKRDIPLK